MASLWEAAGAVIGFPPLNRPVPGKRSRAWDQFCSSISSFSSTVLNPLICSPSWLYFRLHSHPPPSNLTWGTLLADKTDAPPAVVQGLLGERPLCTYHTVTSWNVRWLVNENHVPTATKKTLITNLLVRKQVVCLQETHWSSTDALLWQHGLVVRNMFWSGATKSPVGPAGNAENPDTDERRGGVAILLPAGYSFIEGSCQVLVPGFAIYAGVNTPNGEVIHLVNMYLLPGAQEHIWHALDAALPSQARNDPKLLMVGDFNYDLATREPRQGSLLQTMRKEWAVLTTQAPTWRGRTGCRNLDGALVPPRSLADWHASAKWTTLSDHALVSSRCGSGRPTEGLSCTPARFWQLPEEARTKLREPWCHVAVALQVPASSDVTLTLPPKPCPDPWGNVLQR